MSIMSDAEIAERCLGDTPMISPFFPYSIKKAVVDEANDITRKIISVGCSSYGYDVRLARDVKLIAHTGNGFHIVDPKKMDDRCLVDLNILMDEDGAEYVVMPPNSFLLGHTVEYFRIPRDVLTVCLGKSTYARVGAIVNVTPLEPEWEGQVVVEVSNSTALPIKVYIGEGIAQFLFFKADRVCETSYADRGGKYQGQTGLTFGKV